MEQKFNELDKKLEAYRFYFSMGMKLMAYILAVMGALLKFAFDAEHARVVFFVAGLAVTLGALVVAVFAFFFERRVHAEFVRLAKQTATQTVDTAPARFLSVLCSVALALACVGWIYLLAIYSV